MRLLLAGVALAATAFALPASAAPTVEFTRECSGTVDTMCYHDFCGIIDCTRSDCLVYTGVLGDGNAGLCVGQARPRGEVE
ncbi:MAG TPA: hypothetical protein VFQ85_06975 [Mycobacteriales bacterium]|jgi:hypothetical protein|nr:hypothetical protein [Mycobacteriales bacterium]